MEPNSNQNRTVIPSRIKKHHPGFFPKHIKLSWFGWCADISRCSVPENLMIGKGPSKGLPLEAEMSRSEIRPALTCSGIMGGEI